MAAKIVFSEGASVQVDEEPADVADKLGRAEARPLVKFKLRNGRDVYIASDRVACVEEIGTGRTTGPGYCAGDVGC